MKTIIKFLSTREFRKIKNKSNMIPRKDDNVVIDEESYVVSYVEFDFDDETVYICVKDN